MKKKKKKMFATYALMVVILSCATESMAAACTYLRSSCQVLLPVENQRSFLWGSQMVDFSTIVEFWRWKRRWRRRRIRVHLCSSSIEKSKQLGTCRRKLAC
jgi:hypothetical protein